MTARHDPAPAGRTSPAPPPRDAARSPLWHLLAVGAGVFALLPAAGPVKDPDVYWHVRLGDLVLGTRALPTAEPWNFTSAGRPWVPHSWLSDVALALAHRAGGWGGVVALRLLLGAALLALLARAVLRAPHPVAGPVVYAVAAVALVPFVLERPQTFALVLLAALLPLLARARLGTPPRLPAVAALGWLWASLHGSWPLLPALLLLAGLCVVADRGRAGVPVSRRLALGALVAVAAAAVTPAGPALLARPFVVGRAAAAFEEWQPTVLWAPDAAAFGVLLAALAYGWARARAVPRSELLWCGALVAAALSAGRNVGFATVLLAPVVAERVSAAVPRGSGATLPRRAVRAFGAGCAAVVALVALASPRLPTDAPVALVRTLDAQPAPVRVLNTYDVGGFVTGTAAPHVSAAVDGRVDALPPGLLPRYLAALRLRGDWAGLLAELRPTHALLDHTAPLAYVLEHERGWRRLGANETFVLLAAP